tara:strand:+ start:341 stop:574 length:234 start_codon:yes stop_codon:yes gene_type:complete
MTKMKKPLRYTIVASSNETDVEKRVQHNMNWGWELYGPLLVNGCENKHGDYCEVMYQAMTTHLTIAEEAKMDGGQRK